MALNYETPRDNQLINNENFPPGMFDEYPLETKEKHKLADMRLKEIFSVYSKQHSNTGGKTLTFDKISKGTEELSLSGLFKLLKDYFVVHTNIKVHFLFKRIAGEGLLINYS
jgi:hypothetical protein